MCVCGVCVGLGNKDGKRNPETYTTSNCIARMRSSLHIPMRIRCRFPYTLPVCRA